MALTSGTRIGPYEITGTLGAGGMGEVYRASDTHLGRQVAIKVLPGAFASDADRLARFEREAKTLAALNHPNIAQIYGFEKVDGIRALVMELVDGPTLADRIAQGPIPVDEALPIAKQIAEALEAAHEQSIIHRDLKPANIKLRPDGTVKVLDFGLAKALEPISGRVDATASPTITSPAMMTGVGVLLGTAAYMSPEQARGKAVDKRSDIWAFGCVLYEMLTGQRAFAGEDVTDTLAAVVRAEPAWNALPAAVPPGMSVFLQRCLHKNAKQRLRDIGDMRLALEGAFASEAPGMLDGVVPRHPWQRALPLAAALGLAGLLVGFTAAWSLWPAVDPRPVTRLTDRLPEGQNFRFTNARVMALSADGRHVVYNTDAGLYLRSTEALEGRVIPGTEETLAGPAALVSPFFSPDGESVGYFDNGQLKRISINGGAAVAICSGTNPFGVSWEADNTILFGQPKGIMRVSANGGTPELIVAAKGGEQVDSPRLLPDGDSVLFSVTTASGPQRWEEAQVVVQSLSSGERKVLLKGASDARYVPTGHLVYALGDALLAVAFDLDGLEVRGGPVSLVEGVARTSAPAGGGGAAHYAISNAGTLVYVRGRFTTAGPPVPLSTLVWVDREGREEALKAPPRRYVYPRLSPDGTLIALDVRDEGPGDIWTWDIRRETMTRLTFFPGQDVAPAWSPDGRRLAWASGQLNVVWQAADGTGAVERLTDSPNVHRPSSFTPDGKHLLLAEGPAGSPAQDLGMLPLQGERRVTWLVRTTFSELNGEISPDGRWLAYESDESGRFEIYVRPFPAVDQGRWLVSSSGGREPLWARNGREIFYVAPDGGLIGVRMDVAADSASIAAGRATPLIAGRGYFTGVANQLGRTYDASIDGARFLRIKVVQDGSDPDSMTPDVVFVGNWLEELKRRVPTN